VLDAQGDVQGAIVVNQDITERKKSEDDLRQSESRLRSLSAEIARVEESERYRLAIYLHDEIGQSLALLRMKLGSFATASKSKSDKHDIKVLRDLLETIIEQTHTLTFELSPPVLYQLGLEAAIEWAGEKISRDHGLDFTFNDDGMAKSLNPDLQAILFRCVRELMFNTVKHAKAKRLTVAIAREGGKILFTIADDGLGFDPSLQDTRTEESGFGLLSVREHLATMGGTCRIQSTPGQGTRITLSVPVAERTP
jgi:signal transduction histidine kinase